MRNCHAALEDERVERREENLAIWRGCRLWLCMCEGVLMAVFQ